MGLNVWDWVNAGLSLLTIISQLAQVPIGMKAQKVRESPHPQQQELHFITRRTVKK